MVPAAAPPAAVPPARPPFGDPDGQRDGSDGGRGRPQLHPRAANELADAGVAHAEVAGHVGVRAAVDGDGEQSLTLALGELADALDREPELFALLVGGFGAETEVVRFDERRVAVLGALHRVDRPVVDDPVEPGLEVTYFGAGPQGVPGVEEGRLDYLLGARLADEALGKAGKRSPVTVDDGLESPLVTFRGQAD